MAESTEFGAELSDFRSRVEELRSARYLPPQERAAALDAALFELEHAADVLWPRYEELAAAVRRAEERGGEGRGGDGELRLLRGLFQRLPLPVALVDRTTVVRRLNGAATRLFGLQTGYATGRSLTGSLAHDSRAAFRSQVAAVARGEGDRSLLVRLLPRPDARSAASETSRVTLTALRPADEPRPAVLAVFEPGGTVREDGPRAAAAPGPERRHTPALSTGAELAEVSRSAEQLDLLDDMATALLRSSPAGPEAVLESAALLLRGRFADWVVVDLADGGEGGLRRALVCGPEDDDPRGVLAVAEQSPQDCPLVVGTARKGVFALTVRPDDPDAFGRDATGVAVLVRARVTSLLCVPLHLPEEPPGPDGTAAPLGTVTLFRTGGRRPFAMAEAGTADRMSRHLALALRGARLGSGPPDGRPDTAPPDTGSSGTGPSGRREEGPARPEPPAAPPAGPLPGHGVRRRRPSPGRRGSSRSG